MSTRQFFYAILFLSLFLSFCSSETAESIATVTETTHVPDFLLRQQELNAQGQESKDTVDLMNQIRREKFDLILPQIMRDNKIDMWMQVIRPGIPDPLAYEFGSNSGVFIFTDRNESRIERAVFDSDVIDPGAYDIIHGEVLQTSYPAAGSKIIEGFQIEQPGDLETELDYRFRDIGSFVAERDPKRIAVNFSEKLGNSIKSARSSLNDGLSYTDYLLLVKALGDNYTKRIVSAEYLITEYLARRVTQEIELYRQFGLIAAENLDKEFAKIVPGVTKLKDLQEDPYLKDRNGNKYHKSYAGDYEIQRGDLVTIFQGFGNRIMHASLLGTGYVLLEGETDLPQEFQQIWKHSMNVREILQIHIKAGHTTGELLKILINKVEEAGYFYIPVDQYDINADPEKTQVHFDIHAKGKREAIPSISPLGPDWRRDMMIPLNHTFVFEYMIHMPVPEWGRENQLFLQFHDTAIVTENGIEFPSPPSQGIRLIN